MTKEIKSPQPKATRIVVGPEVLPDPIPHLRRIDLATIDDVRLELANVYRSMKSGQIDPSDGTKLAYVLSQLLRAIETSDQGKRLELIELQLNRRIK
jgi:hypothetical protein